MCDRDLAESVAHVLAHERVRLLRIAGDQSLGQPGMKALAGAACGGP